MYASTYVYRFVFCIIYRVLIAYGSALCYGLLYEFEYSLTNWNFLQLLLTISQLLKTRI